MKGLKETLILPWTQRIEALHFFIPFVFFMVDSLVWRQPMPFMVGSVRLHSSSFQEASSVNTIAKLDRLANQRERFASRSLITIEASANG